MRLNNYLCAFIDLLHVFVKKTTFEIMSTQDMLIAVGELRLHLNIDI